MKLKMVPIFSIVLAIIVLLFFIGWCYFEGHFSTPGASNAIQAALVGILVIITGHYAYATHKQANVVQKQIEGAFWETIIEYGLKPWIKHLHKNKRAFQNFEFVFGVKYNDFDILFYSLSPIPGIDRMCENYLMKEYGEIAGRMRYYRKEVEIFEKNLLNFSKKFWVEKLSKSVQAFIKNKSGTNYEVHEVLEWTIRKLLMAENQFKKLGSADSFSHQIWEPFLKEKLAPFLVSAAEKEEICTTTLRLLDKSAELYDKLSSIQFQLCEEYNLPYQPVGR
jgi:hypothetical protein